jgi:hypothetical protein
MAIAYYTGFTDNIVFYNGALNVFYNQLYSCLTNAFTTDLVTKNVIFDGAIALELQGTKQSKINYVAMLITSEEMYRFLSATIYSLDVSRVEKTPEFLQLHVHGMIIRISLSYRSIPTTEINGLTVRYINDIK